MSCSINNIARVIDVRQVIPVDTFKPLSETLEDQSASIQWNTDVGSLPVSGEDVGYRSDPLSSLVSLFANFLRQLISLVSDNKAATVPDLLPLPEVQPRVVPDPPAPAPAITIPGLSEKRNGAKPDNIWSGFRQGPDGNCVTVSAMRDSFRVHLTHEELRQATAASNFHGNNPQLLSYANFLFAVSAKRAQWENNDFRARQSYEVALQTLNDGEFPGEALRRLGLFGYIRESSVDELLKGAVGTLADSHHSVAVIDGALDFYGQKRELASSRWMNTGLRALKLA